MSIFMCFWQAELTLIKLENKEKSENLITNIAVGKYRTKFKDNENKIYSQRNYPWTLGTLSTPFVYDLLDQPLYIAYLICQYMIY